MIYLPASVRVYPCLTACDMRKSFDGLHALVREHLELDAFAGHLFVFASRRRDRIKILYWDRRLRDVEQATGGGHVRGAIRRQRHTAPTGDHGARIRGAAERNRPEASYTPQALLPVRLKNRVVSFCSWQKVSVRVN
jgi:hypothetical protein